MPLLPLAVLLLAALLHAIWNGLLRGAGEKYLAMYLASVVGALISIPLLWIAPPFPAGGWGYLLLSGALEALYTLLLVSAYRHGDFSVVYPIARGTSPAFLTLWAFLFLGERPAPLALVGIGAVVVGLVVVGLQGGRNGQSAPSARSILLALAVALSISLYSAVDAAAVQTLDVLAYSARLSMVIALLLTPLMLRRYGAPALRAAWREGAPRIIAIGVLTTLAYLLVLGVYQVAPVSYAGAIREVSVLFAAILGKLWFQEPVGLRRAAGIVCIFGGALLITGAS